MRQIGATLHQVFNEADQAVAAALHTLGASIAPAPGATPAAGSGFTRSITGP